MCRTRSVACPCGRAHPARTRALVPLGRRWWAEIGRASRARRPMTEPPVPRVTLMQVAARAGVSRTTASFVTTGRRDMRISVDAQQRVLRAARELGYRPSLLARSLRTNRSQTIGLLSDGMRVRPVDRRTDPRQHVPARCCTIICSSSRRPPAVPVPKSCWWTTWSTVVSPASFTSSTYTRRIRSPPGSGSTRWCWSTAPPAPGPCRRSSRTNGRRAGRPRGSCCVMGTPIASSSSARARRPCRRQPNASSASSRCWPGRAWSSAGTIPTVWLPEPAFAAVGGYLAAGTASIGTDLPERPDRDGRLSGLPRCGTGCARRHLDRFLRRFRACLVVATPS